jgi:hypothetical protein
VLRRLRREAILTGCLLAGVVALSMLGYYLFEGRTSHSSSPFVAGEPATLVWQRTESYRTEKDGIGLTVHSYQITPDHMAFLYSLDNPVASVAASPGTVSLTDDRGRTYAVLNSTVFGSTLGVTAALLVTEPYSAEGKTLTLTVTDVVISGDASGAKSIPGTWSVPFLETLAPGAPVDHTEGGRIAPQITRAGGLTMAIAGPPGGRFPKLLIDRQGEQGALYGQISGSVARSLSEAEFRTELRAAKAANAQSVTGGGHSTAELPDDYPPPPDWPAPRSGS